MACCPQSADAPPVANRFGPIHYDAPVQTEAGSKFPPWCGVAHCSVHAAKC